jgi:hypothetical protein
MQVRNTNRAVAEHLKKTTTSSSWASGISASGEKIAALYTKSVSTPPCRRKAK